MLLDVPGITISHTSLGDTGVTAVVAADPRGMRAAVDVRGGGPGTRETDLLEPHNTVERVNAILLCGGSAFGLAAADGAMAELERRRFGFEVFGEGAGGPVVPIVPAAVIFDLAVGDPAHRPSAADGVAAVAAALEAGVGAEVASGSVDAATGRLYGDAGKPAVDPARFAALTRPEPRLNTTIGVVATDAPLHTSQLKRLAMTAHDGIARAVRPAHSPLDGDTLFAVSTGDGRVEVGVDKLALLGEAAADAVQAAIVDAVTSAVSAHGVTAWRDLGAAAR